MKKGLILLDLDFVAGWSGELKAVNERKEGARHRYPESFVKLLAVVHAYVLPYRQLEGFMRALSQHVDGLKAPDYSGSLVNASNPWSLLICAFALEHPICGTFASFRLFHDASK